VPERDEGKKLLKSMYYKKCPVHKMKSAYFEPLILTVNASLDP